MQLTNFTEANQYLSKFYGNVCAEYTLENMRRLMDCLDNPQDKFKAVHVAGTSGKTSTAYYMSALLTAAGSKTGLTVSPHVDQLSERVQINNEPISEDEFCESMSAFLKLIETSSIKPSWFEVMVAFAYWYFAREKVEYAVVEVGLGGLKDGTNVISRADKVCIITDIGLDHLDILGKNLREIAAQKAGIVQASNKVFINQQVPEIIEIIETRCLEVQASLHIVKDGSAESGQLPTFQRWNWRLYHAAFQYIVKRDNLPLLERTAIARTMHVRVPGRMEMIKAEGKTVIMDGAHNFQKMAALIKSFQQLYPDSKPAVLISLKEGKEYKALVQLLAPIVSQIIITTYSSAQDTPVDSMDPEVLATAFKAEGAKTTIIEDPSQAVEALLRSPETVCLITGSFYLLGQIRNNKHLI